MRAALAIGLLASWDFSYSFHELIDPWAAAQEPRRRLVAGVALDAASSNHDIRPVVLDVLGGWCRKGTRNLRWTAATALGYDLGLLDPDRSLKDLLAIGELGKRISGASRELGRSPDLRPRRHTAGASGAQRVAGG